MAERTRRPERVAHVWLAHGLLSSGSSLILLGDPTQARYAIVSAGTLLSLMSAGTQLTVVATGSALVELDTHTELPVTFTRTELA